MPAKLLCNSLHSVPKQFCAGHHPPLPFAEHRCHRESQLLRTGHRGPAAAAVRGVQPAAASLNGTTAPAPAPQVHYEVSDAQPLAEGENKYVLSVFVADEAGLINQVSRVFTEAGRNIESLAVGLNVDTALFTIVVAATPDDLEDLKDRLNALPKVLYVENLTEHTRVERELVLIKVRVPSGQGRTEISQLSHIFRAHVLDAADDYLTLVVTGDSGKTLAFQRNLAKFGIVQLARTGRVSLKRGNLTFEVNTRIRASMDEEADGADGISPAAAAALAELQSPSLELWEARSVISEDGTAQGVLADSHTLSIEVGDKPGTLTEVTDVLAAANVNVQSLAVGTSEQQRRSRITMVVPRDDERLPGLIQQIEALKVVGKVTDLTDLPFVARELMIVKVRCSPSQRGDVKAIAEIFQGTVNDVSAETVTLELQGKETKMIAAQGLLKPYGIVEVARTGRVALPRDSGINTKLLNAVRAGRVML